MRAIRSVGPPGGKPCTIVTGRAGQSGFERAGLATSAASAAAIKLRRSSSFIRRAPSAHARAFLSCMTAANYQVASGLGRWDNLLRPHPVCRNVAVDLRYSAEQEILRNSAEKFLAERYD